MSSPVPSATSASFFSVAAQPGIGLDEFDDDCSLLSGMGGSHAPITLGNSGSPALLHQVDPHASDADYVEVYAAALDSTNRVVTLVFDNGSPLRVLAFPLVVIGANSIFIYCAYHLTGGWLRQTLATHLALPEKTWHFKTYELFGEEYKTMVAGALVIVIFWLVLLWMYVKRIFVKI